MKNLNASELSRRRLVPAKKSRKQKTEKAPEEDTGAAAAGDNADVTMASKPVAESKND